MYLDFKVVGFSIY